METADGAIVPGPPGRLAGRRWPMPGQPDRQVALKRRDTAELIAEELRRLDPDEIVRRSR